jgi:hypothetical protein
VAYTPEQKVSMIRQLAQLAAMIGADHSVGFSVHAIFKDGSVTSIGGLPDHRDHIDKLIQAMDKSLFRYRFFAYVGGAREVDKPVETDDVLPEGEQH